MDDDARLWDVYEENVAFGGVPIADFVGQLTAGDHGVFSTDTVVGLLEKLLDAVLDNMDVMAESNPALLEILEDKKEEQTLFYRQLIADVRGDAPQ